MDIIIIKGVTQWAKSPKKKSVGAYFWQYGTVFSAELTKNALLQVLPTGYTDNIKELTVFKENKIEY